MSDALALQGIPASPGARQGRARVLPATADVSRVGAGEILVTRFAHPEIVSTFGRIAGVITDQGGRLSHAAVVAREWGVPAVVGTQEATKVIADGSTVVLDGTVGSVLLLSRERI